LYASTHFSGVGRSGSRRWNTRHGNPDHAAVSADLDPKLHRLPLGIPASCPRER
jgi:hypothetical protein